MPYFSVGVQLTGVSQACTFCAALLVCTRPPGCADSDAADAEPWSSSLLKAAWAEFVCTLLFLYLSTGCICFGCHRFVLYRHSIWNISMRT